MSTTSSSMFWVPTDSGLKEICELLAEYQLPTAHHEQIYQRVETYGAQPEFSNYLAYLLTQGSNFSSEIRQCAGLLLKNKLRYRLATLPPENLNYIYESAFKGLGLSSPSLRQTAGTVISAFVSSVGLPDSSLFLRLTQYMESADPLLMAGAMDTALKICEDCPQALEPFIVNGNSVAFRLLHLILGQFNSKAPEIRRTALSILNIIVELIPPSSTSFIQEFREGLIHLHEDSEPTVLKEVCFGMTQLVTFHQECMLPYLKDVIRFMLECMKQSDISIAMESCEFWTAFVDANLEPSELQPFLSELLPILLSNMAYDEDDEAVIEVREAEELRDDNEELRPYFGNDPEGERQSDEDDDVTGTWTLRKCSAAGLDKLSTMFGDDLLQHVMPLIQQWAQSSDWRHRECALLVLGAISDGCRHALEPFLKDIVDEVIKKTEDSDAVVRMIACWTLSRYAKRIVQQPGVGDTAESDIDRIFNTVVHRMHDTNRQVQLSACSAMAGIGEISGAAVVPRLKFILENLATACRHYNRRNLRTAYDAIAVLAESAGMAMVEHRQIIMPPLFVLFDCMDDNDKELQPLLYCLSVLATSFGENFHDYASRVFNRCLQILQTQLERGNNAENSFLTSTLDLISGIVEGLGVSVEPLISPSELAQLLFHCCQSNDADVRQSAFALLGELADYCPSHLRPTLTQYLTLTVKTFEHGAIREDTFACCNNACWALGLLSLRCTYDQLHPVAIPCLENCVNVIMNAQSFPRNLVENATITLGRVALLCASDFAPHLHVYGATWCQMLRNIRDDTEKEQAFVGLFNTMALNPNSAIYSFPSICMAIASWACPIPGALKAQITEVLQKLEHILKANGEWERVWEQVPQQVKTKLQNA